MKEVAVVAVRGALFTYKAVNTLWSWVEPGMHLVKPQRFIRSLQLRVSCFSVRDRRDSERRCALIDLSGTDSSVALKLWLLPCDFLGAKDSDPTSGQMRALNNTEHKHNTTPKPIPQIVHTSAW